jgi:hypothetical protein
MLGYRDVCICNIKENDSIFIWILTFSLALVEEIELLTILLMAIYFLEHIEVVECHGR